MTDTISKAAKERACALANEAAGADLALARVLQEHSDMAREVYDSGDADRWSLDEADALLSMILPDDKPESISWNEGTPPRDGTWVVELYDDSSGGEVIAWYRNRREQEGWHTAAGDYYSDDPNIKTRWVAAPRGFVPWIENISAAKQDAVEAAWDEAESEAHPAPITLTYFMKALDAAGYTITRKDDA